MYFLITILFSINVFASPFFPIGKTGAKTTYGIKTDCESIEGVTCYDIEDKEPNYLEVNEQGELIENATKKSVYMATQAKEAAYKTKVNSINDARGFGRQLKQEILIILADKNLSTQNLGQVFDAFKSTFLFLEYGFIAQAKTSIRSVTLTSNTISSEERDSIVTKIDSFLGI